VSTRVLLVVDQLRRTVPGGIGRYASALLDELAALGAEGPAMSLLAGRSASRRDPDPLGRWGFPVRASRLPSPLLTRAWDRGLVRAPNGFDVVHSVSLAAPPVHRPRRGERRGSPALAVTVHDLAWRANPEATTPRGRRWHEAALQRALRRADALMVPSRAVADDLLAVGVDAARMTFMECGADHLPPPDRAGADALLHHLGVTGPYFLSAGTREPRKNLHRLVAAYSLARSRLGDPWPLVVVGPSGWGDTGIGAVPGREAAAPPGVVPAGLVSDEVLAGLYQGAQVFAYVPLREGYGLPPLEAMTFGIPVVAGTMVPSVAPTDGSPTAALLVDPLTVEAIADALVRAATDDGLRAQLSSAGAALAASRTWSRTARQHIDLWESLA
jgi:glycosyltransferase involved in cell wall biosynthesis